MKTDYLKNLEEVSAILPSMIDDIRAANEIAKSITDEDTEARLCQVLMSILQKMESMADSLSRGM